MITINGEIKETKEHKDEPEEYKNVKIYASNPWGEPSKAEVKSLEFKNVGKEILLKIYSEKMNKVIRMTYK